MSYMTSNNKTAIILDVIVSFICSLLCGVMIYFAKAVLKQTRSINNVSVNIINMWIYKFMIVSLILQIVLNAIVGLT